MTSVEEFKANMQMVHCRKMQADITAVKCKELKQSGRYEFYCQQCSGGEVVARKEAKCVSCGKVKQIKAMDRCNSCYYEEIEKPKREESKGRPVVPKKKGVRACAECGEEKKIFSHDVCAKCAYKLWGKGMVPPKVEPAAVQEEEIGTAAVIGDGTCTGEEAAEMLEDEIMFDESLPGTPAMAALAKEVEGRPLPAFIPLLPVVSAPVSGRSILLPESLAARLDCHGITDERVIDLLDALVHGELERHPYRRVES